MSSFSAIDLTLRTALSDLALGVPLIGENTGFDPDIDLTTDIWIEAYQLPAGVDSLMKNSAGGSDENTGIFQVSVMTKNTNDGTTELLGVIDTICTAFQHGSIFDDVYIVNGSRAAGRIDGGYYRIDISIDWLAYIDRV